LGIAAAACATAKPIVWNGLATEPTPASLPAVDTKNAPAAVPSTPSQSRSSSATSGTSVAPGCAAASSGAQSSAMYPSPS
jgi:hypothetical protein